MKLRPFLLFAFLIFSSYTHLKSQEKDSTSILGIELNFSPNYSYRFLRYDSNFQGLVDAINEHINPFVGYNIGIAAKYHFNIIYRIDFGIQYAVEGFQFIDVPVSIDQGGGSVNSRYECLYLEFPLRIRYKFIKKPFSFHGIGGYSIKYFLDSRSINNWTHEDGSTEKIIGRGVSMNANKLNFNLVLGVGTEVPLSNKLRVNVEPIFRFALRPIEDAPIKTHNYSIGAQIGIEMRL